MIEEIMLVELVWEAGVDKDRDKANEAQCDVYREPRPDSTYCLYEPNPCAPLDDGIKLGSD